MTTLAPLEDRVLIRPHKPQAVTAAGIYIPDTAQPKPQVGTVLAVGPGKRPKRGGDPVPLEIEPGDNVAFSLYGGTDISIGLDKLVLVSSFDVLAVIESTDNETRLPTLDGATRRSKAT